MSANAHAGITATVTIGLVLLAAGCAAGDRPEPTPTPSQPTTSAPRPVPTRAMVSWMDQMCRATNDFELMREDSPNEIASITDPSADPATVGFDADAYVFGTSSSLDDISYALYELTPLGIQAPDRLQRDFAEAVDRIRPEVTTLDSIYAADETSVEAIGRAKRVADLVASMPDPDLPALVEEDPLLAEAHDRASGCASVEPGDLLGLSARPETAGPELPRAKDGRSLEACKDGNCEILVTKPVDLTLAPEVRVYVFVRNTKVTLNARFGPASGDETTLSEVASAVAYESAGQKIAIEVIGINRDGAVLKITRS